MKKKYMIIGAIVCIIVVIFGFIQWGTSSFEETFTKASKYKNYELVCNMEMLENDELKSYQVTSTYASLKEDYYKVELYDKSLNQAQVIVKNAEGVFVLTPSLNQAFQFQSEWPNNSPKPYIYQSLLSFIKDNKKEKVKDGYIVKGEMTYENDDRVKTQEVKLDKDLKPVYVSVFDGEGSEIIKVTVTSFVMDKKMTEDMFSKDTIMKESQSQYKTTVSSSPLYPVALMGSTLSHEKVSTIDETTNHILKFTGEKSFTIVESVLNPTKDMQVEVVSGDMIDFVDGIGFIENQQMTYISSGVVCSLYSNDLTKQEMITVLSSLQPTQVK